MSDTLEQLRQQLQTAQRALLEAQARCDHHDAEHQAAIKELEDNRSALLFMLEDLELARKQIEQAHKEWMVALDGVDDAIFLHDNEFRILRANRAYQHHAGIEFEKIIGRPYYEIFPKVDAALSGCLPEPSKVVEEELTLGDRIYRARAFPIHDEQSEILYCVHSLEDITERKRAEVSLQLFRSLIDNSSDAIELLDPVTLRFLDMNDTGCRDLGYIREELLSMNVSDIDPVFNESARKMIGEQIQQTGSARFESVHRRKDGSTFPVEISSKLIELDKPYLINIVRDISERKRAELTLQRTNRALLTLSEGNSSLIHATDEPQLLQTMCRVAVEKGGYRMAWVGYVEQDESRSIRPMAQAGFEEGYLEQAHLTWAETERGQGPVGRAVRNNLSQIVSNIATDTSMTPWRAEAIKRGYASIASFPLHEHNKCFGVLTFYSSEPNSFDSNELALLQEMAGDLTFGILTLRIRKAHAQHELRLHESLLETIQACASIVEMRDPYTAGHQRRVAEFGKAIAQEMGLPDDESQVIYLAGLIHDVGKVNIPSEVLSKPGRLTQIEYAYVQTHAQAGYDLLKTIHFPWPIAQLIWQHHERTDGSGYPQGLKGEQILLGARILAVADVVEAISSHRPYRPGLGMQAALSEIKSKRGICFDPQVVDACLRLFHERDYRLPD